MEVPHDLWEAFRSCDYYEQNVSYWIEEVLAESKNKVLYDVGANYGYYCLKLASRAQHIYAFEPVMRTYRTLVHNIQRNRLANVTAFALGLSDEYGSREINLYTNSALNSLFRIDYPSVTGQREALVGKERIALVTLDDVIGNQGLSPPDVIKMDIEGAELFALQGGRRALETHRPMLLLEFNPRTYEAARYAPSDVLTELDARGYQVYGIPPGGDDRNLYRPSSFSVTEIADIIAVPRERCETFCARFRTAFEGIS